MYQFALKTTFDKPLIAMIKLFAFVLIMLPFASLAQRDFLVVIEGNTTNLLDQKPVFGVNVDLMQQDAVLTKVLSDGSGQYYISAKITQGQPIQLRLSKGGYLTKYILIDLTSFQGQAQKPAGLTLSRNLDAALYLLKPDVDLSFAKNTPTDKYVWSPSAQRLEHISLVKSDADTKALDAYQAAVHLKNKNRLLQEADKQMAAQQPDKAIVYLDSILDILPSDPSALQKKQLIQKAQQEELLAATQKAKQAELLEEARLALAAQDLNLAERKLKEASALRPGNTAVEQELAAVTKARIEAEQNQAKSVAFQKTMQAAAALMTAKRYDEAASKYNEALQIQPTQKDQVDAELRKIKDIKQDLLTEAELKKTLKLANDQYLQKKYDIALETYKKADKQIALFHKQSLMDTYSKELQAGMKRVTEGINSMSQVYQNQLAKANENFNKGPQFYTMAKNILNSDPMKSRQNEPEVIELKEKISAMEAYYAARKAAYGLVKTKDNAAALKALEKLHANAQSHVAYLGVNELNTLQKSADSLRTILAPAVVQTQIDTPEPEPAGIRLSAPGQEVTSDNSMVFSDLRQTRDAKEEAPYRTQQQIRTEVEYQNYFSQQNAAVGSFETTAQLELSRSQRELSTRQADQTQATLQADKANAAQATEVAITARNTAAAVRQQENDVNLSAWKDAKDYQEQTEVKAADERQQYELNRLNTIQNQKDLQLRQQAVQAEKDVNELNQRSQTVAYTKQIQQDAATNGGIAQYEQIQQTAASTVQLKTTPNYLRDENGVLFPSNTMTEKTYQIKNKEGYVTKVVIRRVVVDANGYGVVYEQTTDENGKTYFTRDGQVSTEYVWFNDSTGANVLKK